MPNWKWLRQPARCCSCCGSGKEARNMNASVTLLHFQPIWAKRRRLDGVWFSIFEALGVSDSSLLSSCHVAVLQKHVDMALPVTNDCSAAAFHFLVCSLRADFVWGGSFIHSWVWYRRPVTAGSRSPFYEHIQWKDVVAFVERWQQTCLLLCLEGYSIIYFSYMFSLQTF